MPNLDRCTQCDNSGAVVQMMSDVAREAANQAAERVSDKLRLEMLENHQKLKEEIVEDLDKRMQASLGMSTAEHTIDHAKLADILDTRKRLAQSIINKVGTFIIIIIVSAALNHWTTKTPPPVSLQPQKYDQRPVARPAPEGNA